MNRNPRCLYNNSFRAFLHDAEMSVLGALHNNYHGDTRTTTTEAWKEEITIMRDVVSSFETDGYIIFEYDIPRLGKRIDVVLLRIYRDTKRIKYLPTERFGTFCRSSRKAKTNRKRASVLLPVCQGQGKPWSGSTWP